MTITNKSSQFFKTTAWLLGTGHGHHWASVGSHAAWMSGDLAAFDAAMAAFAASHPDDWGGVGRPTPPEWEHTTCTRRTIWRLSDERLLVILRSSEGGTIATLAMDARNPCVLTATVCNWRGWLRASGTDNPGEERGERFAQMLGAQMVVVDERAMGRAVADEMF